MSIPLIFLQDPSEILDYIAVLKVSDNDTVSSASWVSSLTIVTSSHTTTTATVRLSASGHNLGAHTATVHIVGASGQEYEQSINIQVVDK